MTEFQLETYAKKIVADYVRDTLNKGQYAEGLDFDVHTVWKCWILENMKFLITSDLPDGRYFEVTYNAFEEEFYLDVYVRTHNEAIALCDILDRGEAPAYVMSDE
jgi:hypothetical protein